MSWVHVTNRLPEEGIHVLVTLDIEGHRYVSAAYLLSGSWYYVASVSSTIPISNRSVIGWQPFPEPMEEP